MPTMANITVKKDDGTTDVTYSALAGSSGETVPALWRNEAAAGVAAYRPTFKVTAKSGPEDKRVVEALCAHPITRTDTNGNVTRVGVHLVRTTATLVMSDSQASIDEAVSQGVNLAAAALVKAAMKEGYAPRG